MRVVVMGGSLGGLNAALWLRDAGCDVYVHERSRSPLEGRGAGIVLHPAVLRYFTQYRGIDFDRISAAVRCARYLSRTGTVAPGRCAMPISGTSERPQPICFRPRSPKWSPGRPSRSFR